MTESLHMSRIRPLAKELVAAPVRRVTRSRVPIPSARVGAQPLALVRVANDQGWSTLTIVRRRRYVMSERPQKCERLTTFGWRVFPRCHQLETVELLELHLEDMVRQVQRRRIGVFEVRRAAIGYHRPRYETD